MNVITDNSDLFLTGFKNTGILFAFSAVFSLILGTIVAGMRVSPAPAMRAAGTFYVNAVRNTPLTVILAFLAPIVVPVVLIVLAILVFRLASRIRDRNDPRPA